jgi:hypothetical protein
MAASDVDNAQTAKSQTDPRPDKNAIIVRAAMNNRVRHSANEFRRDLVSPFEFEYA